MTTRQVITLKSAPRSELNTGVPAHHDGAHMMVHSMVHTWCWWPVILDTEFAASAQSVCQVGYKKHNTCRHTNLYPCNRLLHVTDAMSSDYAWWALPDFVRIASRFLNSTNCTQALPWIEGCADKGKSVLSEERAAVWDWKLLGSTRSPQRTGVSEKPFHCHFIMTIWDGYQTTHD